MSWRQWIRRCRDGLRRMLGSAANVALLSLLAGSHAGFVLVEKRWCAAWLGPEPANRKTLKRLIQETYEQVVHMMCEDLHISPPRRAVFLICGGKQRIEDTVRMFARAASLSLSRAGSCFWAPDIVFVASHPQQVDFKGVVAHELSHALGYVARGGVHASPWIDEGTACLIADRVSHQDYALNYMMFAGSDDPDQFRLPVPLRMLFQPTQTLDNDNAQWMLTAEAALFVRFLSQRRIANGEPWNVAQRVFAGLEPETTLAATALERAFGTSLDHIEREFTGFCSLLLEEHQARSKRWTEHLLDHPPKTN